MPDNAVIDVDLNRYAGLLGGTRAVAGKSVLDATHLGPAFSKKLADLGASRVNTVNDYDSDSFIDRVLALEPVDCSFIYLGAYPTSAWQQIISAVMLKRSKGNCVYFDVPISGSLFERRVVPIVSASVFQTAPSLTMIREIVFSGWATRDVGAAPPSLRAARSIVMSCREKDPIAVLIGGDSKQGKTVFAATFSEHGIAGLHFDFILSEILFAAERSPESNLSFLRGRIDLSQIGTSIDKLVNDGFGDQLSDVLLEYFSNLNEVTIAEGYALQPEPVRSTLILKLKQRGFRVFNVNPA